MHATGETVTSGELNTKMQTQTSAEHLSVPATVYKFDLLNA